MNLEPDYAAVAQALGTPFTVDDDYTPGTRQVSADEVFGILSNAYRTGLCVELCHDKAGDYLALHDGAGLGYGRFHFPTA